MTSEPAQQDLIQVPSALLNSITSSLNDLRNEVSQLRAQNAALSSKVERLEYETGTRFPQFNRLPPEVRNLIWIFAISTPQILLLTDDIIRRSAIQDIMSTCQEARRNAMQMKLSYFEWGGQNRGSGEDRYNPEYYGLKQYFNIDIDTILLKDKGIIPGLADITCGHCSWRMNPDFEIPDPNCTKCHRLLRIAMPEQDWHDPQPAQIDIQGANFIVMRGAMTYSLVSSNVQELYLVVGDLSALNEHDVTFITPRRRPGEILHHFRFHDAEAFLGIPPRQRGLYLQNSWEHMALQLEKRLKHFKDTRAAGRKCAAEEFGLSPEQMDAAGSLGDLSSWDLPRVKYVEAITERDKKAFLYRKPFQAEDVYEDPYGDNPTPSDMSED
ncbi:hypothetical protein G7Y89_g7675 [Cudoniella acicularis]|uniref:2EXR domain-containing protein n=1 Tax=Cudoniella acicularis TaxID=354080 RepID=A0A8H4W1U2_9HELO|nr:hypothetical protein G7Y89_g7675 [Cudoniella acicularis]